MSITQDAIFVGANKQSFASDYCAAHSVVAYGAGKTVALWNPTDKSNTGVHATLKKHTKEITCVRFIPNSEYLVSAGEDGEVNVWKFHEGSFILSQTLKEHQESVTCIGVLNNRIFVTGGSDSFIVIWGFVNGEWTKVSKFQIKDSFYPLTLELQSFASNEYLLAVGGTTVNLFIYTFLLQPDNSSVSEPVQAAVLTGHEDWIKCLSFVKQADNDYILASGSQDRYIRLWRLKLNEKIDNTDEDSTKLILLSNKQYKFTIGPETRAAFSFEALIMGHDDWVTGLAWSPDHDSKLQLLSSSADTALMIWEMDYDSGIWVSVARLGELSIKGASTATGASGGFWSCMWFVDGDENYILTNGKTGAIRAYKTTDKEHREWNSVLGITGPTKEVTDIVWSLNGEYFMATSLDQTTRLLAQWKVDRPYSTWHEFARPQIHGYDMICLDNLTSTKFVSAGDEKILRVFEMTRSIGQLLEQFTGVKVESNALPDTAALPVLGLSNKAASEQLETSQAAQQDENDEEAKEDVLSGLTCPPFEDYLQRFTLFPEIEKLYGHGYEVTCCATSPSGNLIASACKSNSAKHGVLRIFNAAKDYQLCEQVLPGHNLTVTSIEFSPDGKYLVSVSRDRQFCLWRVVDESQGQFELVELNTKAHSRILWDCSWLPVSEHGTFFVTGSRDKQIKLWSVEDNKVTLVDSIKVAQVVSSVSSCAQIFGSTVAVAGGLENGDIQLFKVELASSKKIEPITTLSQAITPADKISKLSFSAKLDNHSLRLAVGSTDSSLRVYSIPETTFV